MWKKIYSQTQTQFELNKDFKYKCNQAPTLNDCAYYIDNDNFIDLNALKHVETFRLKILWTGVFDMFGFEIFDRDSIEWVQSASPTSATEVNMNPTQLKIEAGSDASQFAGLSISKSSNYLFAGTLASTYWFYVIGFQAQFHKPPAYIDDPHAADDMNTRRYASKIELFLEMGDASKPNI